VPGEGNSFPDSYYRTEGGFVNVIVRIIIGGLTGWLTGKAVEVEGRAIVVKESHISDAVYGIIGAMIGEYLFFWMVIGKGNAFSSYATAVLGSITLVGAARLLAARWNRIRS
jgi:uncharacterized membrane protein YeaQ/YmgE (transglycosylase-associated protein family)